MLLDSSVFIDLIRKYPPATESFNKVLNRQSASIIAKLELIAGLKSKREIKSIENMFKDLQIKILPMTEEISDMSENIFVKYYHSHGIGILDSFITATALVYNEELVTRNTKHFDFIPNLKLIKPY
ncbi:MAG: PilT protein domain protein [Microgenomates group bacterium GW2011_GWC1_37_8]|uniref:PilT protein domain protein n=2 Tax=Candidatus Woeseibacteriota TaxID=1752722 RepID=A0A0G0LDV8_9BACT|nr:MAG: PilT protein domain protein [Microgenomates group bacterium GW2011_GWC1_37_8]KKQ86095.1 MAG: PilT protein domain protein [Candidatus Woesebacteria bacterium GW2011_GWB1_38_8]